MSEGVRLTLLCLLIVVVSLAVAGWALGRGEFHDLDGILLILTSLLLALAFSLVAFFQLRSLLHPRSSETPAGTKPVAPKPPPAS